MNKPTPAAINAAYDVLRHNYIAAKQELDEAIKAEVALAERILWWATASEADRADAVSVCPDCGCAFVRVPCPVCPTEAHCPACGGLVDYMPVTAAETVPTEDVSIAGVG